jgi:hypothetical protein
MDTREKLIKARLGLLALAEQLQNVRQACKAAGISRSHYYEIKQAYEKYGAEGLAPQLRRRPRMPNQTPPELERQILEMTAQSVVDAHCSLGFARLYLSKAPITAADTLHHHVLPFYEEHGVAVEHLLTDNGREFCGRELHHPFELYLAISQVRHRRTEVRSPETNGFCERFHRTLKEEFFAVAFRKTFYESVEHLQADLDQYLNFYNRQRAHQGYRTQGRTPYQAFLDGANKREEVNEMPQERVA